jgi:hypothetical protein
MDSGDPLYHRSYLMPGTSLSFHPYLAQITFEYLEYMDVYRMVHKILYIYSLVFTLLKCIYYLLNYLLIKVVFLFYVLLLLVVKNFWRKITELYDDIYQYLETSPNKEHKTNNFFFYLTLSFAL